MTTPFQRERPSPSMRLLRFLRPVATSLVLASILCGLAAPAARALSLLRDPDIEHALNQLADPVLRAAGLGPGRIDIMIIDDPSLNAFVVDPYHIFLHSGLILRMKTPAMLQAVIAHEAGHITNGHMIGRPLAARNSGTAAKLGMALAVAAGALTGNAQAALGVAAGTQGAAIGTFLAHSRAQENAADQTSMRYLARAGIDPQGAVEVMNLFRGQEALSPSRRDAWARTHPLSRDRYRVVRQMAEANADKVRPQPQADYWFARAKSKLSAFQRAPKWTQARAGEYGFEDVRLMREAIAYHRRSDSARAVATIDRAIALRPEDPYLHELKGQILMESRRFEAAAAAYGRAAQLAPDNALIIGAYGRALLAEGQVARAQEFLEKARQLDGRDVRVMRDLAVTYARQERRGMAAVVTAERYAMMDRMKDAALHAKRASDLLPRGSGAWQRAQDVLSAAKNAGK